jgi:hypothetical protein
MRRILLVLTLAATMAAMMALAGPASANGEGTTFVADSCENLRTIVPPEEFVILPLQGTTVTTPSEQKICAPKPAGGPNRTGGGGDVPIE